MGGGEDSVIDPAGKAFSEEDKEESERRNRAKDDQSSDRASLTKTRQKLQSHHNSRMRI
jgi:hypothetical protein